jgi:TMEM175 potassium channel family protein
VFLAFVVLVPFATSIWTEYADTTAGGVFFDGIILICGLMLYANWSYVGRHPHLLRRGITSKTLRRIHYRNISVVAAAAVAIGLAFFSPVLSNLAYALIFVIAIFVELRIHGRDYHGTEQKRRRRIA